MRTLHELLVITKAKYIKITHVINGNQKRSRYDGICEAVKDLRFENVITEEEEKLVLELIEQYISTLEEVYDGYNKVNIKEIVWFLNYYAWPPDLMTPRVEWLDDQITQSQPK